MTRSQKADLKKFVETLQQETREGSGRINNLTWEKLAKIKGMLYQGNYQKYVFQSMGIPKTTWDRWAKLGRDLAEAIQEKKKKYDKLNESQKKYITLAGLIAQGKAAAMIRCMGIIHNAAPKDWKAAQWFLEINDQENYGKKVQADINANIVTMDDLLNEIEDEED